MKIRTILLPSVLLAALTLIGCDDRKTITYQANVPVYLNYETFRKDLKVDGEQEMEAPGKIYFKDDFLYINEIGKGLHLIDNSNPASPSKVGYIDIPGNFDMAIRGNLLYADSYVDLVMFDITEPLNPVFSKRIENFFTDQYPAYDIAYPVAPIDQTQGVVVGWKIDEVTEEVETNNYPFRYGFPWSSYYDVALMDMGSWGRNASGQVNVSASGQGGSMAKFIVYGDFLYMLDDYYLKVMNIGDPQNPQTMDSVNVGWGMETVFIADGFLYMGSNNGMGIYDLSDPSKPVYKSYYWHVTSCDPVVVQGNIAYVTMRSGNTCEGNVNRLDIVSVASKENPTLLKSYEMQNPHGLGIDNTTLFICEGDFGLKVFDATDLYRIKDNLIAAFPELHAYDVIPIDGMLYLIGNDGLGIYDYTDPQSITKIGELPIED